MSLEIQNFTMRNVLVLFLDIHKRPGDTTTGWPLSSGGPVWGKWYPVGFFEDLDLESTVT